MEMIMFRTSSVFICCLLLITLPKFHCQEPLSPPLPSPLFEFSVCKEQSYNCGNLTHIFYPFWGQNRPFQCGGGDSFQLNCHGDDTTIVIGSQSFIVKNISMNDKTMKLVSTDLAHDDCYPYLEKTYVNNLNPTLFGYPPSVYNITIFYDCPSPSVANFTSEYYFMCGDSYSYYVVDNKEHEKLINELSPLCKGRLHVPTDAVPDDYYGGDKKAVLKNVLEKGFEVNYNVPQDCERCLGIEGDCWSDGIEKHIHSCYYCADGSHDCYHEESGSTIDHKKKWNWRTKLIVVVVAVLMGGFMICIIICLKKCMPSTLKLVKSDRDIEAFLKNHGALAQRRYKYSELKKMTNSFKVQLGQGGFGAVYKGELLSGFPVAVKILNASKGNGEDFINEVASISRTSHVNIVTLLGFCLEGRKKALIYEFMPNGSLDKFVYNKGLKTTQSLSWDNLWQIAIGIARGLEYLHRGCNTRILHFDIKPHNILLDETFCPKISDFGLAKLCPRNESIISMSDQRGTIGYVAPEVWNRHFGGISHKSDVYSYGMMLIEMVGGRNNINAEASHTSEIYFPDWIYNRLEQGGDLRPNGVIAAEENEIARRMTMVGLWCVQTFPKDRPTMSRVIDMLEGNMNSLEMPPKPVLSSPPRLVPESITSSSQFE